MTNFGALLSQIPDILTAVEQGDISLITLNPNEKVCLVKNWNQKVFDKDNLLSHIGNFGIKINKFSDGTSLICIDIDGTKTDNPAMYFDTCIITEIYNFS